MHWHCAFLKFVEKILTQNVLLNVAFKVCLLPSSSRSDSSTNSWPAICTPVWKSRWKFSFKLLNTYLEEYHCNWSDSWFSVQKQILAVSGSQTYMSFCGLPALYYSNPTCTGSQIRQSDKSKIDAWIVFH